MVIVNAILYLSSAWLIILSFNQFFLSTSCHFDLLWKILEIIENVIFSLVFVLRKIWYFSQLRKMQKIWYLGWTFFRKWCLSCSVVFIRISGMRWQFLVLKQNYKRVCSVKSQNCSVFHILYMGKVSVLHLISFSRYQTFVINV